METATQPTAEWIALSERLSPEGQLVMTKIDDGKGVRNEQSLVRRGGLWFTSNSPDAMYVYYAPTHWKPVDAPAPQETPVQQELLSCPFCGAPATRGMFNVWCDACQAQTVCDSDASTEQIIASWNTRYRDPAFQKLVEAVESLLGISGSCTVGAHCERHKHELEIIQQAREALRLAREGGE